MNERSIETAASAHQRLTAPETVVTLATMTATVTFRSDGKTVTVLRTVDPRQRFPFREVMGLDQARAEYRRLLGQGYVRW
jgi:hypothetical protein